VIAFLSGIIHAKNLRTVVVLVGGVGYKVSLPLSDISCIRELGENIFLHIHTHVREDALDLYGFLAEDSLTLFEHIIAISGVGPKLALSILSGMETKELIQTLVNGDFVALTRVPGVGQKTAQRLVLELKDRLSQSVLFCSSSVNNSSQVLVDLRSAISNLGYKPAIVEKAVKSVEPMAKQGLPLELLVKEALRQLN
jgi:holliday junction DNA helicase RuvA